VNRHLKPETNEGEEKKVKKKEIFAYAVFAILFRFTFPPLYSNHHTNGVLYFLRVIFL